MCTDNDTSKIQTLEYGGIPIYEPGLEKVIPKARKAGRLNFCANPADAVDFRRRFFICVGTPPLPNGDADLSAIDHVARLIATEAKTPKLVVEKSTVPAQTGQELKRALAVYGRKSNVKFQRRLKSRIPARGNRRRRLPPSRSDCCGCGRRDSGEADARKSTSRCWTNPSIVRFTCPPARTVPAPTWLVTTINSAELIKHASNSFLALKISYANMVSDLAERLGADIGEVVRAMGMDPRIGPSFLSAGLGFGGFCLPKDLQAFVHLAERSGVDFTLLQGSGKDQQAAHRPLFTKSCAARSGSFAGSKLGVLGLAFKPNTDDVRFAPAIDLVNHLLGEGASSAPTIRRPWNEPARFCPHIEYAKSAYDAAEDAEALLIATEWDEFRKLDWDRIRDSMARPLIVDGRNLLSPQEMKAGFEYRSFGRPD